MLQAGIRARAGEIFSFRHSGLVKDECSRQAFGLGYRRNGSSRHSGLGTEECPKKNVSKRHSGSGKQDLFNQPFSFNEGRVRKSVSSRRWEEAPEQITMMER